MTLIRLNSDNYTHELLTPEAYEAIALNMSTGDYCTHKADVIIIPETDSRCDDALELSLEILNGFQYVESLGGE